MIRIKKIKFLGKNFSDDLSRYFLRFFFKNKINKIILTGGTSAPPIYVKLMKKIKKLSFKSHIYLSDERLVGLKSKKLNANLFKNYENIYIKFSPILLRGKSYNYSVSRYNEILPKFPSFILLSMGSDGHIASIFPQSKALKSKKKVVLDRKVYNSFKRVSITMNYLKNKRNIFILCKIKRLNIFNNLIKKKSSVLNFLLKINPNFKLLIIRN